MYSTTRQLDFRPESPSRPANWRLQLAELLAAGRMPPYLAPFVDAAVRAAAASLTGKKAHQAVGAALAIASDAPLHAAEIQGRVIAGQSNAEIADAMQCHPITLAKYLGLFFDVRPLLNDRGRIRSIAAGGIDILTPTPENMIRWAGYCYDGATVGLVAEYFRCGFDDGRRIVGTPELDAKRCQEFRWVRLWLSLIDPVKDPGAVVGRGNAYRKKASHKRRRTAAGKRLPVRSGGRRSH